VNVFLCAAYSPGPPGIHCRMLPVIRGSSRRSKGVPFASRVILRLLVGELGTQKIAQILANGMPVNIRNGTRDPVRLPTAASAAAAAATDEFGDNTVIYQEHSNDTVTDTMDEDKASVRDGVQTTVG